jgi:hypothetical protein
VAVLVFLAGPALQTFTRFSIWGLIIKYLLEQKKAAFLEMNKVEQRQPRLKPSQAAPKNPRPISKRGWLPITR